LCAPASAIIESDGCTAVVGDDEVAGVVRIDPEIMKIAVRARECLPRFAGIGRAQQALIT
jgi:hypothetical protein